MDENPYRTSSVANPWTETSIPPAAMKPLRGMILNLRIIIFSLVTGVVLYASYTVITNSGKPHSLGGNRQPINLIMLGFGAAMLLLGAVLPSIVFRNMPTQSAAAMHPSSATDPDVAQVVGIQQRWLTAAIVGCAFFEGGAFANVFAYMISCELLNLLMSGALLLGILTHFPLPGSCERRIERELREIGETPTKSATP